MLMSTQYRLVRRLFLGCFPFVKTDRPGHSCRNEKFTFNQSYPAKSVKSYVACMKEIVFHKKKLSKKSHGLAGQFWLLESTLCCFSLVYSLVP